MPCSPPSRGCLLARNRGRGREGRLASLLEAYGYDLLVWEEPGEEPEATGTRFADIVPGLRGSPAGGYRLYRHQAETIEALRSGRNVVLTARTGSGKTEAWALAALAEGWRVLAVYPTLALAADQIRRLEEYYRAAGYGDDAVLRVDRPSLEKRRRRGASRIDAVAALQRARVVVTNPAFLLAEMKRLAVSPNRALLEDFLSSIDLVVFDELDFYGPRGAHLLLSMIELISAHLASKPPRVVVLSATLGNPGELADYLSRITGRETRVVEGRPFKTPNRSIVVLGKGLKALREYVRAYAPVIKSRAPWVLDIVYDEEELREHFYEVYEALEAIGLRPPRPGIDHVEVLRAVLEAAEKEPGMVTLVFVRSIRAAERLYRRLMERLPAEKQGLVAVHHHLVSKERREAIEEKARRAAVKLVITVRTLAQGIDIGNINRVVHVGLPPDLREYMQREGRKGRRRELGVTESVVVPAGLWDRKLLEAGSSALRQWLSLPLEKLYINPLNAYAAVFRGLWRLLRGIEPPGEELRLLQSLRLVEERETLTGARLGASRRGWSFWNDIGFYEHGPPYGYRKVIARGGRETLLRSEEVSVRDVVEKYQPGSFDPMTENMVVRVEPREYRVYEQPPEEAIASHDWLSRAVARYEDIKRGWGERPSFLDDLRYGRIFPAVVLNVSAPTGGFGELQEEPVEVEWLVESRRPRISQTPGGRGRVYHDLAAVELQAPVAGRYRDYTYGHVFEAPGTIGAEDLRLGLAVLLVYLRLDPRYALPLGLLQYRVVSAGSVKLIHLWEREAAGLLEKTDWLGIASSVEKAELPSIVIPLVAAVDPPSAVRMLRGEVSLARARQLAAAAARVIAGSSVVETGGLILEHPRPDPGHGVASLAAVYESLQGPDGSQYVVAAVASWDGSGRPRVDSLHARMGLDTGSRLAQVVLSHLDRLASSGARIYYYGQDQRSLLLRLLAGSYTGAMALRAVEQEGRLLDAAEEAAKRIGDAPLLAAVEPRIRGYLEWASRAKARRDLEELENAFRSLAAALAEATYRVALALEKGRLELRRRGQGG